MRISDWSSDVCSSDLIDDQGADAFEEIVHLDDAATDRIFLRHFGGEVGHRRALATLAQRDLAGLGRFGVERVQFLRRPFTAVLFQRGEAVLVAVAGEQAVALVDLAGDRGGRGGDGALALYAARREEESEGGN